MDDWTQTLDAGPLLAIAAGSIALILLLVIKFKLHAFLTLVIVAALTAVVTGIPTGAIADLLVTSFGTTLGSVALLVGLGAMLGRLVETSGGARVLADRMVDVFGEKRAPFALGVASLIMGFPIFFDAGLIVMLPIVFAVARRMGGKAMLLYGISAASAFSVMHVFLPPHPGPVSATELLGANLGIVLVAGLVIVFPVWYVSGYLWAKHVNKRIPLPVLSLFGSEKDNGSAAVVGAS
jgi:GntP family gluconate:H+ symporter